MRIGVIGANGNLGSRVVKYALEAGYEVTAFVYHGECDDQRATVKDINLFDMTKEDIKDIDVLISAFGGGFSMPATINQEAYEQYIKLLDGEKKKLIAIAGAGSLYTDASHTMFEYESESHPSKLKEISKYIRLGVEELKQVDSFEWLAVCPSRFFDLNGPYTNNYTIGLDEEVIYNEDGDSYVTYDDLAKAMVDLASDPLNHKVITISTKTKKGVE